MKPVNSFQINRTVVAVASAVLLVSAGPIAAQVSTPGNGKALPDSAQNAPPFQGGGGGGGGVPGGDYNALLDGEYTYTGAASCLWSPSNFNGNFQPNNFQGSFVSSYSVNGIRTFNGNGTGTLSLKSVSVSPGGAGAVETMNAPFTYQVASDMTITLTSQPSISTQTAGGAVGSTSTLANVPVMTGRVSEDLSTITLSHPLPGVESVTSSFGTNYRVCWRERTLHRVKRAQ